jgi:hypothetical protein
MLFKRARRRAYYYFLYIDKSINLQGTDLYIIVLPSSSTILVGILIDVRGLECIVEQSLPLLFL